MQNWVGDSVGKGFANGGIDAELFPIPDMEQPGYKPKSMARDCLVQMFMCIYQLTLATENSTFS